MATAPTVEAEVLPPNNAMRPSTPGVMTNVIQRPGYAMFMTGFVLGLAAAGLAVYCIRKKL